MKKKSTKITFILMAAIFLLYSSANATIWREHPDAGQTLGTAQSLPEGIDEIHGWVSEPWADLYSFSWNGGVFFVTDPDMTSNSVYTNLFLFDSNGYGIIKNYDLPEILINSLSAGNYFLAVSSGHTYPVDSDNNLIFPEEFPGSNIFSLDLTAGPLHSWTNDNYDPDNRNKGSYTITFNNPTAAPVPEPATMLLFGTGLAGLAGLRKRNKK